MSYWQPGNLITAAKLNGQPGRIPAGMYYRSTVTGGIGATRALVAITDTLPLEANSTYLVTYYARIASLSGTPSVTLDLRTNSTTGTVLDNGASTLTVTGSATAPPYTITGIYATTAAENTAFAGTLTVSSATGVANIGAYVIAEKVQVVNGVIETS